MTKNVTGDTELAGPLEGTGAFPERLTARVVTPGHRPRVHGYDVEGDLAKHYTHSDLLFLSLTGDLPDTAASAAFSVALVFLSPVSIAHASTHGASLARLCGATTSAVLGVAAIGLAEQARMLVAEHRDLLRWLDASEGELPAEFRTQDEREREAVDRLVDAVTRTGFQSPVLRAFPTRDAALLILLHSLGFRRTSQLEAVVVAARLPSTMAEALAGKAVNFNGYPINLPRYEYDPS
jgi:hypothetical protein